MNIPEKIFKSYDIRGVYPDEINEENIYVIAQAVLTYIQDICGKQDVTISIGRDMRLSAPVLYPVFRKALVDGGAHIIDNGLVSTPTFYFSVLHLKTDAGIQLTASHNPPQYTGLKMVIRDDDKLVKIGAGSGMDEIKNIALKGLKLNTEGGSEIIHKDILIEEIRHAYKLVSPKRIVPLRVVADTANAMASLYLDALFKQLPCQLIKMNFELDGSFPAHQPDPLVFENLKSLQDRVIKEKADLGLAPDGDGDRMFFVDEKGQIISGSFITALVARELIKSYPEKKILFDVRYTLTPKKIIEESGGQYETAKVGHALITRQLQESGGIFGGESSGHYYFKHTGGAESQIPMVLFVLNIISTSRKKLSELITEIRRSYESGEVNFKTDNAQLILDELKKKYSDGRLSLLDGVSFEYKDWRCNIRTSNTEPLLRLNVEAVSQEIMQKNFDELMVEIQRLGANKI